MKIIRDIILSDKEPTNRNVCWIKPLEIGKYETFIYEDGWVPLFTGEGFSTNINDLGEIKDNSELDNIEETGFYTYTLDGTKYNLIVQTYPNRWVVQYQLTANNLLRRFKAYRNGQWHEFTSWYSISDGSYDPNSTMIANGQAISTGLKDSNKRGLFIGDVLNGRYTAISGRDLIQMYDKHLREELSALEEKEQHYDLKKPEGDPQWEVTDTYLSIDSVIRIPTYNTGYNTGYGYYTTDFSIRFTQALSDKIWKGNSIGNECVIHIEGTCYYGDGTIMATGNGCTISAERWEGKQSSETGATKINIKVTDIATSPSESSIAFHIESYFYISKIDILPIEAMEVIPDSAPSLIYSMRYIADGQTINIPKGVYNLGILDETSYSGALHINASNVIIEGEGIEDTYICGTYMDEVSVVDSLIHNSGKMNVYKNFTVVTEYFKSMEGQAPTVSDDGVDSIWINVRIVGAQDTLVLGVNSHAFKDCVIEGTVDFICGGAYDSQNNRADLTKECYFRNCTLSLKGRAIGNCICAPQGVFAFDSCIIDNNQNYEYDQDNLYSLGRPWFDQSLVLYRNTTFNIKPNEEAYSSMTGEADFIDGYGDIGGKDIFGDPIVNFHTPNQTYISTYMDSYQYRFENSTFVHQLIEDS